MAKSQVSMFILIGAVILLLSGIGLYLYISSAERAIQDELYRTYDELIPSELLPFKRYVEHCLDDVSLRGVRRAGAQGGYVYPLESGLTFNYMNPTESDGVSVFADGDLNIPYWVHITGDPECVGGCEKLFIPPPLEGDSSIAIDYQLEQYIERNIDTCIRNQERLETLGIFYERAGQPAADVQFTAESVVISLTYPFEVEHQEGMLGVDRFSSTVDVPFIQYYEDAMFLAALIDEIQLFEKVTLSLISINSGMDNDALPPKAGSDTEFVSTLVWIADSVKHRIQQMLVSTTPFFRVEGTRNFKAIDTFYDLEFYELKQRIYEDFVIPAPDHFSRYAINFDYAGWEPYFTLNDNQQVIRPESARIDWFPWFGINRVRTMYGLSYPVVITLSDPDVLNGQGFVFSFAMEANIRNNQPMNETYESFDYSVFDAFSSGSTFLCDPDMRTSEEVSFQVMNGVTNEPEPDVAMLFSCGSETCSIGRTGEDGIFRGSLPVCLGGRMQLAKPDFETIYLRINPSIDFEVELGQIPLEPFRYKNITVSRAMFEKDAVGNWGYTGVQSLDPDEQVVVSLERVDLGSSLIDREPYFTFALLEPGEETTEIQILPGRYTGQIISVIDRPFTIEPREECVDARIFGVFGSEECFDIPEEPMTIEQFQGGLARFDENTLPLHIRKESLDSSNLIELRHIFVDIPNAEPLIIEDLEQLGMLEEYVHFNRNLLGPFYR